MFGIVSISSLIVKVGDIADSCNKFRPTCQAIAPNSELRNRQIMKKLPESIKNNFLLIPIAIILHSLQGTACAYVLPLFTRILKWNFDALYLIK